MNKDFLDGQIEGQITLADVYQPPERLIAVSRIFARARKEMTLNEQKTFVYALAQIKFKEKPESECILLDKKELAAILGIHSDRDHLSVDLYSEIRDLPKHSYIEIAEKDLGLYSNGFIITAVTRFKNVVRLRLNNEYMPLFTNLSNEYITMWSSDIFRMTSQRSVQFYEYLRQETDTREKVNYVGLGVKVLKEMFGIPKDGKGSYMRKDGHFDRTGFERYVIDPLCEDLNQCKMIQLLMQPDGKLYEKIKSSGRVLGYRFYWTFSAHPAVATAAEVRELKLHGNEDPEVLKIAKDIAKGKKKPKAKENNFHNFEQRQYSQSDYDKLMQSVRERQKEFADKE